MNAAAEMVFALFRFDRWQVFQFLSAAVNFNGKL